MKEDRKIGIAALSVGLISIGEAWSNILTGGSNFIEIFFLGLGLIASLAGIALVLQHKRKPAKD